VLGIPSIFIYMKEGDEGDKGDNNITILLYIIKITIDSLPVLIFYHHHHLLHLSTKFLNLTQDA
jgi:hypothetical protein